MNGPNTHTRIVWIIQQEEERYFLLFSSTVSYMDGLGTGTESPTLDGLRLSRCSPSRRPLSIDWQFFRHINRHFHCSEGFNDKIIFILSSSPPVPNKFTPKKSGFKQRKGVSPSGDVTQLEPEAQQQQQQTHNKKIHFLVNSSRILKPIHHVCVRRLDYCNTAHSTRKQQAGNLVD